MKCERNALLRVKGEKVKFGVVYGKYSIIGQKGRAEDKVNAYHDLKFIAEALTLYRRALKSL